MALVECILEAEGLTKNFKGFSAVSNLSLSVRKGSVHALIGPNGAGKTTCFNLLTKFLQPSAGAIKFKGRDITGLKADAVARLGMVRSFQISAVFANLTVLENVRLAIQRRRGEAYDFWRSKDVLRELDARALELIDLVGLTAEVANTAGALPYGRKRALELATTLALDPELLLLDEPTAGMGHEDIGRVANLIREVAKGRTILMVEHNLGVVADLCDTITVLARGEKLAEGTYEAVSRDPRVVSAYIGGAGHA